MSDNVKVFEQYSWKTKPKSASAQDNQPEYRAIGLDKTNDRQSRLRIHYVDGTVDVFICGRRIVGQQGHCGHDLTGLAIAALRNLLVDPCLLDGM